MEKPKLGTLLPVAGVRLGIACAGIKKPGRRDVVVIEIEADSQVAAVFTQNAFCAAPVTVAKQHLSKCTPRYLLINTGNANAGTGASGLQAAEASCQALAQLTGGESEQVLPFSTGVIGEPLPLDKITSALPLALESLRDDAWADAACGILTTDTVPKGLSKRLTVDGHSITITGIAKGAGMIKPNMATMLAYVATDAKVQQELLQQIWREAAAQSFNRITVDGDTSTNDAAVFVATGKSDMATIDSVYHPAHDAFKTAVFDLCEQLAINMIRDAEGATKLITVEVIDGANVDECEQVAYTVAHSPLVKTAMFASDPNWGRILAAIGRAGLQNLDIDKVQIQLGDVVIVQNGGRSPEYTEARGQQVMQQDEINVRISLSRGEASARVWTCDFSYDYVRINAEYRT